MSKLKSILYFIFCPLWFYYSHNVNEKICQSKKIFLKYLFVILVVLVIVFIGYYKEIIGFF